MADPNTIIITGASSGIGRVTAAHFLSQGWKVGLIGRREDQLREAAGGSASALVLPCDVTQADAVDAAFDEDGRFDLPGALSVLIRHELFPGVQPTT